MMSDTREKEHPGDFIEFKCGNCGQIKSIARTALRFEHRCAASCETTATGEPIANFCFHDRGCPAGSADSVVRWRSGDEENCACGLSVSLASAPTPGPRPETVTAATEQEALQWLMDNYGMSDTEGHGPTLNLLKVPVGDSMYVFYLVGTDGNKRRFSQALAAFASRPPAAAERTK